MEIVSHWASMDAERLAELDIEDEAELLAAPPERREAARAAAFRLFDAFVGAAFEAVRTGSGDCGLD